ncbi:MAG: exonuclease domain-containing protein [Terriglobia bacterium]
MSRSLESGPIAVIDVETTGLFPFRHDRVVEIALVLVRADGRIEREFVSLVNPKRDLGPSSVHGLTSEDIRHAPHFSEIAALVIGALDGAVALAAHNARFDRQFLETEFSRLGCQLPDCLWICTMQLAGGGGLTECCLDHGISTGREAHHAIADARAAAQLLTRLLSDNPRVAKALHQLVPIRWPVVRAVQKHPVTRDESRRRQSEPPTFLRRLLERRRDHALPEATEGAVIAYGALLDRALEDRLVDDSEADALVEMAVRWGLTADQIEHSHINYLHQLASVALADGNVTEAEQRDLKLVARLLGRADQDLDGILSDATSKLSEVRGKPVSSSANRADLAGKRVCFTGELQCRLEGHSISRELAEELARKAGLVVLDSVTKTCDLLVVADPQTQSGKANKARRYGTRIMHETVFWNAIGVRV